MKPGLYNIRRAGYEKISTTSQGHDIYAKGNWRALYDPETDRDMVRFIEQKRYFPKRGLSQVVFNGRHDDR